MTDYISREEMREALLGANLSWEDWHKADYAVVCVPAADVRPVVLCRDCVNRFMTPNGWHCYYAEWAIEDDDFCSCGEKREES